MNYTIHIEDRDYIGWTITPHNDQTDLISSSNRPLGFHPLQYKLFHGDCFHYDEAREPNAFTLLSSPLREPGQIFQGILIVADGKTYGRTKNKKRLLYKCIPHNPHCPSFLVPYDVKLELSKHIVNKYVLFKYVHWDDKHPLGELVETIGPINTYDAFEKYQLHCNGLCSSIAKYTNHIKSKLEETNELSIIQFIEKKYQPENRTTEYIFSIDNDTTTDYDDAMSINENVDGSVRISIYIANVLVWLQELDGWANYSSKVSTIYLPTKKIPMLPNQLSENLCSLIEKRERFAIVMDYVLYENGSYNVSFRNTKIRVKKNYEYEAIHLLNNPKYKYLLDITKKMDANIQNSHEVVAFWMIKMNQEIGALLHKHTSGIFRLSNGLNDELPETAKILHIDTERVLYNFRNHICSKYSAFEENKTYQHNTMLVENYVHFTSPIRRLVDLLNQLYLWPLIGYTLTTEMKLFVEKWSSPEKIEYINTTMKSIRKTQTNCELVHMCYNEDVLRIYNGVVFDKLEKTNIETSDNEYIVYIKDLKYLAHIKCCKQIELFSTVECKIYVFHDKSTLRDKFVLKIIE